MVAVSCAAQPDAAREFTRCSRCGSGVELRELACSSAMFVCTAGCGGRSNVMSLAAARSVSEDLDEQQKEDERMVEQHEAEIVEIKQQTEKAEAGDDVRRCCECGKQISMGSTSGLCRTCAQKRRHAIGPEPQRYCANCESPISLKSRSGLCRRCVSLVNAGRIDMPTIHPSTEQREPQKKTKRRRLIDPGATPIEDQLAGLPARLKDRYAELFVGGDDDACKVTIAGPLHQVLADVVALVG